MQRPGIALSSFIVCAVLAGGCTSLRQFSCDPSHETAVAPANFGEVVDAKGTPAGIYRGAQPLTCAEIAYLKHLGVKSIVKLNDTGAPVDESEKQAAEAAGIHVESFGMSPRTIGSSNTCADVRKMLRFLETPSNRPAYVHCTAGRDRTGYLIGAYEETVLHKPVDSVLAELAQYGHHGYPTWIYPGIRRELRTGNPQCAATK